MTESNDEQNHRDQSSCFTQMQKNHRCSLVENRAYEKQRNVNISDIQMHLSRNSSQHFEFGSIYSNKYDQIQFDEFLSEIQRFSVKQ